MTFITLMKGFIGTAILFMPREVRLGGYLTTLFSLAVCGFLSYICAMKLLQAAKDCNAKGYMDCGGKAYGENGKTLVGIFIVLSQMGFTIAFIYFICS